MTKGTAVPAGGGKKRDFLQPDIVSRIEHMDLRARLIVEGFIAGLHRSPYHGFSVEFAEYRQYGPGESTRNVDWKIYAKTDRYYVKVFEDETNLRATLLLDRSGSMGYGAGGGVSKLRWGSMCCGALAWLLVKQRDAVGLALFDERVSEYLPHRSVKRHLFHLLRSLEAVAPGARTGISRALHELAELLTRRGLVVLVSDLLDDPDEVTAGLRHFRHRGHEVIVFHVLDPREIDLDLRGETRFRDLETGETLRTQPWFVRREYRRSVDAWRHTIGRRCVEHGIDYVPVSTATPFDEVLAAYLGKRRRLR